LPALKAAYSWWNPSWILSLVINTAQSPHYSVSGIPQSHQRAVRRLHGELAMEAQIVEVAGEHGLNPRPAGHNDSAWIADCPRRTHALMLSPSLNEFGCGYCRRKGDAADLRAFVKLVRRRHT
jgi:hypothetical protein